MPADCHLLVLEGQDPDAALPRQPDQGLLGHPLDQHLDIRALPARCPGVPGVGGEDYAGVGRDQDRAFELTSPVR
jgi:hypothetical protein